MTDRIILDKDMLSINVPEVPDEIVERGGPGSGHHGHLGRPGEVGGSLPRSSGLTRAIQHHFGGWLGIEAGALPLMDIPLVSGFGYDDRHPSLLMALKEIQEEIGDNDIETVYILSDTGEIELIKKGGKDYVILTDYELENSFDKILVHNHPSDNSFSEEDVMLMAGTGVKEIVVVGLDGTRYMMRMLKKVNSIGDTARFFEKVSLLNEALTSELWDAIHDGEMTRVDASATHYDMLWNRFEEIHPELIDYRVERVSG